MPTETPSPPSWQLGPEGWTNVGGPAPSCTESGALPLYAPVDAGQASSLLLPGQVRGGDFKPHGGFRFDAHGPEVVVRAPFSGTIVRAAHYLEGGESQYLVDMVHPCGLIARFDHLARLEPAVAAMFEDWPPPAEGDTRTRWAAPPVTVAAGQPLATTIGVPGNVFVDFGVYDLRAAPRDPSPDPGDEFAPFGVCWLDWFDAGTNATVAALPTSGVAPAPSAYCPDR